MFLNKKIVDFYHMQCYNMPFVRGVISMTEKKAHFISNSHVEEYVKSSILRCTKSNIITPNFKYHHNTKYDDIISILDYGILSLKDQINYNIRTMNASTFAAMSDDESHINGVDGISLAVVGLTDLSKNEEVYDPYMEGVIDILISGEIKATRNSHHYGNEFITYHKISPDKIKGIDLRILKLIRKYASKGEYEKIINIYNIMIKLSKKMVEKDLSIPLREMSNETLNLDIYKLSMEKVI